MGIPLSEKPSENALTLIPLKRKNALFVVSPLKSWLDAVVYWKKQLDTIDALGDEPQLFVSKPQNRSAAELLNVLNSILSSGVTTTKKKSKEKEKERKKRSGKTGIVLSAESFKATVDKERNALIIMAYPSDYKKIRRILEKLDTQPKQVLVEVTIAEVTLTDQFQYGFEWYLKHAGSKYVGELQTLGGLGIGGAGFNYSLIATSQKFNLLFNTFAKKNLINIISTPHIVVLDGKEATINVGTEVPVVSSETSAPDINNTAGTPSILRNVQYRNTGVILSVKPIVTSNNMLTIEVSQELSEAQANNVSNIDSPIILNRSITTSLVLKSGETVLLGGLISENKSKTRSEVPVLGDLPLLGNLFKVESKGNNKTELIVLITPHIINTTDELKEITNVLSQEFEKEGMKLKEGVR
jgi:general secretion pathway protein D